MKPDFLKSGGPSRTVHGRGLYVKLPLAERMRVVRGVPQAVVKVSSFAHGVGSVGKLMKYISRDGELPMKTENGEDVEGLERQKLLVQEWARNFDESRKSRDAVHIVFSMPPGSNTEALCETVQTVLERHFADHHAAFVIHEDRKHPHAHAIIAMRDRQGEKKLELKKADLYELREVFAEAARENGVELAASSRAARGVGRKGLSRAVYQIRQKGITPRVEKEAARELMMEMKQGTLQEKPWEKSMRLRNQQEREAYRSESQRLRLAAGSVLTPESQGMLKAAAALEVYAKQMPTPKTRRQAMLEKVRGSTPPRSTPSTGTLDKDSGRER